jgi:hypothetical protein
MIHHVATRSLQLAGSHLARMTAQRVRMMDHDVALHSAREVLQVVRMTPERARMSGQV